MIIWQSITEIYKGINFSTDERKDNQNLRHYNSIIEKCYIFTNDKGHINKKTKYYL